MHRQRKIILRENIETKYFQQFREEPRRNDDNGQGRIPRMDRHQAAFDTDAEGLCQRRRTHSHGMK